MNDIVLHRSRELHRVTLTLALICVFWIPSSTSAQSAVAGYRGICNTSTCSTLDYSFGVIDASAFSSTQFTNTTGTICGQVNAILEWINNQEVGTVSPFQYFYTVDARGINGSNYSLTCVSGETPFASSLNNGDGMTLLLPAQTINISTPWSIPQDVEIIGSATTDVTQSEATQTVIAATGAWTAGTAMIQINTTPCCHFIWSPDIKIDNLVLDGKGQNIIGISDTTAGPGVRVNHVGLFRLAGTGLYISGATDSGPYTDITFDVGNTTTNAGTTCAQIINSGGTKGIHGLRCISYDTNAAAGLRIDSSDNTIENVVVQGFQDGVLIGSQGAAQNNHLSNIVDSTSPTQYHSSVHITNTNPVTDLTIVGVNNECMPNTSCKQVTIQDDVTSSTISDTVVGTYFLGNENVTTAGYSRFSSTVSVSSGPNVPTWLIGTVAPTNASCSSVGTLYSNTIGSGAGLWVCANTTSGLVWTAIK
jgi:hypothetical protein